MYFTAVLERIIYPPPKSRVSSMDVLHQNAITMQVWPFRTQLTHILQSNQRDIDTGLCGESADL
jgi:hypothetical protein